MKQFGLVLAVCKNCYRRASLSTLLRSCWSVSVQTETVRRMGSTNDEGPDHLERTANNTRDKVISSAEVVQIFQLSSSVKGLQLQVSDKKLTFKAGQWVDMMIPDVATVGGFSMSSAPGQLIDSGRLELAIRKSNHPPAAWVHTQCEVGSQVRLQVGGDFHYSPTRAEPLYPLLLIAGGVGINPLLSILRHVTDLGEERGGNRPGVCLLYTARDKENLIFRRDIEKLQEKNSNITSHFFVTQEKDEDSNLINRRIIMEDLQQAVAELGRDKLLCYICGPSPMIKDVERMLLSLDLNKDQILYEQWW